MGKKEDIRSVVKRMLGESKINEAVPPDGSRVEYNGKVGVYHSSKPPFWQDYVVTDTGEKIFLRAGEGERLKVISGGGSSAKQTKGGWRTVTEPDGGTWQEFTGKIYTVDSNGQKETGNVARVDYSNAVMEIELDDGSAVALDNVSRRKYKEVIDAITNGEPLDISDWVRY